MRAEYYYSIVPDVVFSLTGSGGYIRGYGGEDVHLSNRFFIGGNNLRGFAFGGVGPRDNETDDRWEAISIMSARPRFASRWGCPRSCGYLAEPLSTLARCATSTSAGRRSTRATVYASAAAWVCRGSLRSGRSRSTSPCRSRRRTRITPRSSRCPSVPVSDGVCARSPGPRRCASCLLPAASIAQSPREAAPDGCRRDRLPADPARLPSCAGHSRPG